MNEQLSRRDFLKQGALVTAAGVGWMRGVPVARAASGTGGGLVKVLEHVKVFYEKGRFAGWPANHGIWSWGDEILVGFMVGDHKQQPGHTIDRNRPMIHKMARSLDGGLTWALEEKEAPPAIQEARECPGGIDFTHPDFALAFRRVGNTVGPSYFYASRDRGRSWEGPFRFPDLDTPGIATRTDYVVEGKHELLAFLTVAKRDRHEGRVACARTTDGGRSWRRVAWIGPEPEGFAIMPATVRLSAGRILTVIRRHDKPRAWLSSYLSEDNGRTWRQLGDPAVKIGGNSNPPALIRLKDGRLCLTYGVRIAPCSICARLSEDEGRTWSEQIVLRGDDGANFDMGYPRMVQRPDGKVVTVYYYNNALHGGTPYRYIAATIFDPAKPDREFIKTSNG